MGAPILVEPYRLHHSYTPVLARVQAIADQAASLVTRRMRERLPHVTIRVSGERLLGHAVTEVEQQLLGTDRLPTSGCRGREVYGVTTLGPHGAVVVINAKGALEDGGDVDRTLVHELVHAVQSNRPGGRQHRMTGIRGAFGLIQRGPTKAFIRQYDRDEREAQALEHLANAIR